MLLRHLNYFLAVAQYQSFTRAARALHVSQPALSQQVRQLEEHLGAHLFDRTGRLVRLTDAGEVYLRYARQALQDLEEGRRALHDVSDLSRGSLRVAVAPTFTSYLIGPLVEAFYRRYPNVRLVIQEMLQERVPREWSSSGRARVLPACRRGHRPRRRRRGTRARCARPGARRRRAADGA